MCSDWAQLWSRTSHRAIFPRHLRSPASSSRVIFAAPSARGRLFAHERVLVRQVSHLFCSRAWRSFSGFSIFIASSTASLREARRINSMTCSRRVKLNTSRTSTSEIVQHSSRLPSSNCSCSSLPPATREKETTAWHVALSAAIPSEAHELPLGCDGARVRMASRHRCDRAEALGHLFQCQRWKPFRQAQVLVPQPCVNS